MRHVHLLIALGVILTPLIIPSAALPFWDPDPSINLPVSLAPGEKSDVFAVTDGAGGTIIVWEDERSGNADIYAQRIDVNGTPRWTTDGVQICTATNDQGLYHSSTGTTGFTPVMPDGSGGAFIVWQDSRAFSARQRDIYCQRVDANGSTLFAEDGIPIAQGTGMEDQPTLCPDGAGGAIIVWQDKNTDPIFFDLWGQRIDGDGNALWNGGTPHPIVEMSWDQDAPTICADGTGGAFLAWTDSRHNLNDVFAQRLDAGGNSLWTPNGVAIYQHANGQNALTIRRGEDGHPILAWVDRRTGSPDIYAQKLDAASGTPLWNGQGLAVCTAANSQYRPAMTTDGADGAIIAWFDYRNAPSGPPWNLDIYAQRILAAGTPAWVAGGVAVCAAADAQRDVDIWTDNAGGAFLAWEDNRLGTGDEDIYAQRLDAAGNALLDPDGRHVCSAPNNQQRPDVLAGAGGLITTWKDDRDILWQPDVYADRVLTAAGAVLGVNELQVDFGEVAGSAHDTVRVSNVGSAELTVLSVTLALGDQGFIVTPDTPLPATLFPGEFVELVLTFEFAIPPGNRPDHADTLHVFHDAPEVASSPTIGSPVPVPLIAATLATSIADGPGSVQLPVRFITTRPNPFSRSTRIEFDLAAAGSVTVEVIDILGRKLRTLDAGPRTAGPHAIDWDGRDATGIAVAHGVYFIHLTIDGVAAAGKTLRLD